MFLTPLGRTRYRKRLLIIFDVIVEPATGIEPALSAWEADVLPLNYAGSACNAAVGNFSTTLLLYQTLAVGAGDLRERAE